MVAAHDGDDESELAFSDEGVAAFGELESGGELTLMIVAIFEKFFKVTLDALAIGMSRWVAASIGDEVLAAAAKEKNFHDLIAAGALKNDIVEAAAGEESLESPSEFVAGADAGKVMAGF